MRIDIQPKMLDPDPYKINTDPKHWPWVDGYIYAWISAPSPLHVDVASLPDGRVLAPGPG